MAKVFREADEEVFDLLDPDFIEQHIQADVNLIFACVAPDDREDDMWISEDGKPSYLIVLPFEQVRVMKKERVRDLMLLKAQERLRQVA